MCWSRDCPKDHGKDHSEAYCSPAACGGTYWSRLEHIGADIHTAAHGGLHAAAEAYTLKEAVAHEEPSQEKVTGQELLL